jgi:hypothetical protein
MLDWLDAHPDVADATMGHELVNEPASYALGADLARAAGDASLTEAFFALYAQNMAALSDLVQARSDGRILVGGWGYSGQFDVLDSTLIGGVSVLDTIRAAVGDALIWSAHLYPGWNGTGNVRDVDALKSLLDAVYASGDRRRPSDHRDECPWRLHRRLYRGDPNAVYLMVRAYEWFADNGIGAAWFPAGILTPSTLVNATNQGAVRFPNPGFHRACDEPVFAGRGAGRLCGR